MLPRERIYNKCSLVPRLVLICFLLGSLWFSLVLLLVLLCFAFESPWLSLSFSSAFFLVFFGSPWFCFWLFFIATTVIITISGPFCGALGPSRGHLGAILGPRWARLDLIFQGAQCTLKADPFLDCPGARWPNIASGWRKMAPRRPQGGPSLAPKLRRSIKHLFPDMRYRDFRATTPIPLASA